MTGASVTCVYIAASRVDALDVGIVQWEFVE